MGKTKSEFKQETKDFLLENSFDSLEGKTELWASDKGCIKNLIKILFFDWSFFKNKRNDSFIILRSILITFITVPLAVLLVYFFTISFGRIFEESSFQSILKTSKVLMETINEHPEKALLIWGSVLSVVYWNLRRKFADQWMYCAALYNKISFDYIHELNPFEILYLRSTLSLDVLQLDLYTHKSFRKTFNRVLEKSIHYFYLNYPHLLCEIDGRKRFFQRNGHRICPEDEVKRFEQGYGTVGQAYIYISSLQNDIDNSLTEEMSKDYKREGMPGSR